MLLAPSHVTASAHCATVLRFLACVCVCVLARTLACFRRGPRGFVHELSLGRVEERFVRLGLLRFLSVYLSAGFDEASVLHGLCERKAWSELWNKGVVSTVCTLSRKHAGFSK